ncbi:phosphoglycerate mutase family protein [Pseudidiomarina aestuarii]|uniref:phosphoglycerate mutase family protein n=1 Tax=Pseudidiomarina aestuarii TaxID=624146 RepID=UPI003A984F15
MLKGIQLGVLLTLAPLFFGYGSSATANELTADESPLTVFLVRHSEKEAGKDPALTPEGLVRAQSLARLLGSVQLDAVYSTDYRRTLATAKPTASIQDLSVSLYSPRELNGFAEQLKQRGGQVLVVGHSNTTPQLVSVLGGDAGQPIDEKREFDRLYLLQTDSAGKVSTLVLRYGQDANTK